MGIGALTGVLHIAGSGSPSWIVCQMQPGRDCPLSGRRGPVIFRQSALRVFPAAVLARSLAAERQAPARAQVVLCVGRVSWLFGSR